MLAHPKSALSVLIVASSIAAPANAQCPEWKPGFAWAGTNREVRALASFDDGSGPTLFAGGSFTTAGDAHARFSARWKDMDWSGTGPDGPGGSVNAYAVFDSGSGPELYAGMGGSPGLTGVARWTGSDWLSVPGVPIGVVYALAVFDDGSGPALYAAGQFGNAGTDPIAKWDGTSWSGLGTGTGGSSAIEFRSLAVFDDGAGAALHVGGRFDSVGGVAANNIAKWRNGAWSALGAGVTGSVNAMLGANLGGTPRLYVVGNFNIAGGVSANHVASWNGVSWSPLGTGFANVAQTLTLFDDGAGERLYVAGRFNTLSGSAIEGIARWDGAAWFLMSSDDAFLRIQTLVVHDDGTGPALFAGGVAGSFTDHRMWSIAKLSGNTWHPLGRGQGLDRAVRALETFDDGTGSALYAGGQFQNANGIELMHVARYDGTNFSQLAAGLEGPVWALQTFDDGSGTKLFAGGGFSAEWPGDGTPLRGIASWNGVNWAPVGAGFGLSSGVHTLTVFDDGSGPALYAGGQFSPFGGTQESRIARWNGSDWSTPGGGISGVGPDPGVFALAVFDDGSGRALYAGGSFTMAGSTPAMNIARWDGQAWSALGSGTNDRVLALAVFDDGTGPKLYAGGRFTNAGGNNVSLVACWDGASWSPVHNGLTQGEVRALTVLDDGSELIAGGTFSVANGQSLARLSGGTWRAFGGVFSEPDPLGFFPSLPWTSPAVNAFAKFDSGSSVGREFYVGGDFQAIDEHASHYLARMSCVGTTLRYCFGDSSICPCANGGGEIEGCSNSTLSGGRLDGTGQVSLSNESLVLSASGMTDTTALFVQGTTTVAFGSGTALGDGLSCTGGALVRLKSKPIVAGASSYPSGGDAAVSVSGLVSVPGTRTYQVMYRDSANWCTADTFNFTNALQVGWMP